MKNPFLQWNSGVGYGNPPLHSQFPKGQSGNPKGRPKGSKNKMPFVSSKIDEHILKEAERLVSVNGKDGKEQLSMQKAITRSIFMNAGKGKLGAQKLSIDIIEKAQNRKVQRTEEHVEIYIRLIEENNRKRKQAIAKGDLKKAESILPLDEHIEIDLDTGQIKLTGPCDANEKELWDQAWASKQNAEKGISRLLPRLNKMPLSINIIERMGELNKQKSEANLALYLRWHRPLKELFANEYDRQEFKEMVERLLNRDDNEGGEATYHAS